MDDLFPLFGFGHFHESVMKISDTADCSFIPPERLDFLFLYDFAIVNIISINCKIPGMMN